MKKPIFTGTATALVTPFRDGAVDFAVFEQLLDAQLAAGIDALVVCGTTGEASTLTMQEQMTLIAHAIQYTAGRCKIIAGTGSNSTAPAAHAAQRPQPSAARGRIVCLMQTL